MDISENKIKDITKEQLIDDLIKLRQRINELEKIEEDKKRYVEELSKTKSMFEGLFEFAPDAILVVDREGRIVQANKQVERLFGYARNELLNGEHDILLPERFRERHREHRRGFMADPHVRPMGTGLDLFGRKKDGTEFPVDISLGPLQMHSGIVVLAVVRDVTERKKAEKILLETKAELELSNKALEQFAYAVAHDLRAPLRSIDGFIRILSEDYSEKLDELGRDYLCRVQAGATKMTELINALLSVSSYTRGPLSRSKVSLSTLVKTAAAELSKNQPDRRVEFVIADDVYAEGDPMLLKMVVDNLIGNAWKFSEKRPDARIEFGVAQSDGKFVYCVRDNGAGFNMEFADRLFAPFQRLHSSSEFPGLGIGLTTVQRIIDHHGGRIWAEAEVDKGATFCFTL
jgi:PAS domain S-box-containing protein